MNENLLWECLRELILDSNGTNKPKRVLLAEMIDVEIATLNPKKDKPVQEAF